MFDTSKLTSGVNAIGGWVMRFSIINILWLLSNLPILFIIFLYLFSKPETTILLFLVPLFALVPVLFFPSTVALFASVRDWVIKREYSTFFKAYFNYYKSSYKKSFLSGIILTPIWIILILDFYFFTYITKNSVFSMLFLIMIVTFIVYTINFFSLSVHYHMSIPELLKSTFLLTVGNPLLFFTILFTNYFIWYLSIIEIWFLIPLFTGSLIAFVSFTGFYRAMLKVQAIKNQS